MTAAAQIRAATGGAGARVRWGNCYGLGRPESAATDKIGKGRQPRRAGHRSNGCRASRGRLPLEPHPSSGSFWMRLDGARCGEVGPGGSGAGPRPGTGGRAGGERTGERCKGEETPDRWGRPGRGGKEGGLAQAGGRGETEELGRRGPSGEERGERERGVGRAERGFGLVYFLLLFFSILKHSNKTF
jgi:hypothetical protein